MHQLSVSALVQVMACRLFGTKPLPEPKNAGLLSIRLQGTNSGEIRIYHFHLKSAFKIIVCHNGGHFVQGRWVNLSSIWLYGNLLRPISSEVLKISICQMENALSKITSTSSTVKSMFIFGLDNFNVGSISYLMLCKSRVILDRGITGLCCSGHVRFYD